MRLAVGTGSCIHVTGSWLVGWLMESLYSYAGGGSHKNGASTP
jgi:hypothetical protein